MQAGCKPGVRICPLTGLAGSEPPPPGCPGPPCSIPWHMSPVQTQRGAAVSRRNGGGSSHAHGVGHGKGPTAHPEGCVGRQRPAPCFALGARRDAAAGDTQGRRWPPVTPRSHCWGREEAGHPVPVAVGAHTLFTTGRGQPCSRGTPVTGGTDRSGSCTWDHLQGCCSRGTPRLLLSWGGRGWAKV